MDTVLPRIAGAAVVRIQVVTVVVVENPAGDEASVCVSVVNVVIQVEPACSCHSVGSAAEVRSEVITFAVQCLPAGLYHTCCIEVVGFAVDGLKTGDAAPVESA